MYRHGEWIIDNSNSDLKRSALHRTSCKVQLLSSLDTLGNATALQVPAYGAVGELRIKNE
jgi:hypothetical protein